MNIIKMIPGYAKKLSDEEYRELRAEVIRIIKFEDTRRGY